MKIKIGKWELEIFWETVSPKLEEEVRKTVKLTKQLDDKVDDHKELRKQKYGNDTDRSNGSAHSNQ